MAIVNASFGAALTGMRPVAEFQFMDFISCAFNQIINMLAKAHFRWGAPVPVVLRGPSGGGVHGGPFHSQNPETYFAHTPGLKVVCPASAYDAKGLIKSAIRDNNPVLFFEHKFLYRRIKEELPAGEYTVPIGKARIAREGTDVSVITYAAMVYVALEAAESWPRKASSWRWSTCGRCCRLIAMPSATVEKTNRVIVLHEDTKTGGIAGEVAAVINEECFRFAGRADRAHRRRPTRPCHSRRRWKHAFLPKRGRRGSRGTTATKLLNLVVKARFSAKTTQIDGKFPRNWSVDDL